MSSSAGIFGKHQKEKEKEKEKEKQKQKPPQTPVMLEPVEWTFGEPDEVVMDNDVKY